MSKIWETGLPRSSFGPVAVHRCVKSCCRIFHHLLTMAMQISLSQQHRQVLVECDVLQEVKHSLPRRIVWEYLDEGGVDVASLLEQGLVAPVRVQPAQLPRHSVVLPGTSYCSLSSGSQSWLSSDHDQDEDDNLIIMVWIRQRTVCSFTLGSPVRKQNTPCQTSYIVIVIVITLLQVEKS